MLLAHDGVCKSLAGPSSTAWPQPASAPLALDLTRHMVSPSSSGGSGARKLAHDDAAASTAVELVAARATHERHASLSPDVENQADGGPAARRSAESDPYGLSARYKTDSDLAQLKANSSRKRRGCAAPAADWPAAAGGRGPRRNVRKLRGFYENQNSVIERMLKSVEEHRADARQEQGDDQLKYRITVWGSFAANVVLAGLQLYAAISSGSVSLFTTMADAIFDPLSNLTLILSTRAIKRVDPRRFLAGKARLETVGNIVFCFLMTTVSVIITAFAAQELVQARTDKQFHLASVVSVCAAFSTKLALFLYCWSIKDRYSQVNILWQDHRNDLLVNGFGILTSVGGAKLD